MQNTLAGEISSNNNLRLSSVSELKLNSRDDVLAKKQADLNQDSVFIACK